MWPKNAIHTEIHLMIKGKEKYTYYSTRSKSDYSIAFTRTKNEFRKNSFVFLDYND
jgi:hypothetical protein